MTPNNYHSTSLRRPSAPSRAPYPGSRAWLLAGLGLLLGSQAWAQSLDPAFGTGGKVNTTFTASPTTDMANDAALLADGRIVAVGTGSGGFNLARYLSNGSLDPTFGTGGKVTTDFGTFGSGGNQGPNWASSVLIQPDGKIVAAGRRSNQVIVARYTAAGVLDNTFGTGGSYTWTPSTIGGSALQIGLQSSGNIVVFGYYSTNNGQVATIFSLTPNGTPVGLNSAPWLGSFNSYGQVLDGLVDGSDRILALGFLEDSGPGTMRMTRWLADRSNDASFGSNGQVTLTVAPAPGAQFSSTRGLGVDLQSDGKILVVGTTSGVVSGANVSRAFLARYSADGTLDTSFGTNGISLFSGFSFNGNGYRSALGVKALANGKILVRGAVSADFAVAQFNANGSPDTSFGTNGVARVDEGSDDQLNELLIQPDGNYVGVGYSTGTTGKQFTLLRLTPVAAPFVWTGAVSTNWTDAGNWSGGQVPGLADNATIPAGLTRYPVFSASQSIGGVSISSGATLTQSGGTLTVNGAFTNAGTFSQTGGTLALGGSSPQTLGGGGPLQLRELAVGAAGASLGGPVQVERLLTLTGDLATNGNLTLLSNARGTALVVNNGGTATGSATVQRYLADSLNAGRGYRHLSAPVTGGTVASLGGGSAPTVNPAYNSAANPSGVTPFPTVFSYEQQRLSSTSATTSAFDYGWVSPDALSDVLPSGKGYTVNLAPQTISFRGGLFNGPLTLTLPRGATAGSGWHLIGNPYPAPINWDLTTRSGLDQAMYVYRSTGPYAGGYQSYVNGIGAPGANIISEGQAFFVRTSSAATPGTVSFANAARLTTPQNNLVYRTQNTRPLLVLGLRAPGAAEAQSDALYVYREAGASTGFDTAYDALKVQLNGGQQPTLFQLAGTERLAIQGVPDDQQPLDLPLGLSVPTAGTYELAPDQLANFPASTTLYLEDRQTGTWHDLRTGRYAAQLPAGLSTARFVLHLGAARPLATAAKTGLKLAVYPNPAPGGRITVEAAGLSGGTATLQLVNSLGQVVHQLQLPLAGAAFLRQEVVLPGIKAGVYSLRITTGSGTLAQPLVIY